ncbi:MAG: O-unit flippase-like protein, partial [Patescibacteria group bacterium]
YRLLATMIHTARYVYRRLALIVLAVMLSLGSLYIYKVTNGFKNIENSFLIWVVYSISTFFNVYYSYYTSLLTGKGMIMESKKAIVYSRITYIILTFLLLYLGLGLLGVALANLIAPFVTRFISYHYFFTKELKLKINSFAITKNEKIELFTIIWHNARKLGLVFIGSYAINKLSMFLAGLYLSLSDIASYGLMIQLTSLIMAVSGTLFGIWQPRFSALRVAGNKKALVNEFAFSMNIYYCLFIIGSIFLIIMGPWMLSMIGSNTGLPSLNILVIYSIILLLEGNHSNFATFIVTKNNIPFVESSLIAGICIAIGSYLSLALTQYGIIGLILIQGIVQGCYANWKWPYTVCKEFEISFISFIKLGVFESINQIKLNIYGR